MANPQNTYPEFVSKPVNNGYSPVSDETREDVKTIKEAGADLAKHLKQDAAGIASSAAASVQDKVDDVKAYASDYMRMFEDRVAQKPIQTVLAAFAAGMALCFVAKRL